MPPELRYYPERTFTADTIADMWREIIRYSPALRARAEAIVRAAGIGDSPCGKLYRASAIYEWVRARLSYLDDHVAVQQLFGPEDLLGKIDTYGLAFANCVGYATLLGALLAAVGIEVELVTTSTRPDRLWNHIYLYIDTQCPASVLRTLGLESSIVAADPIHGEFFGWEQSAGVTARKMWPAPVWAAEMAGIM